MNKSPTSPVFILGITGSIGHFSLRALSQVKGTLYGFSFYQNEKQALEVLKSHPEVKVVYCPLAPQAQKIRSQAPEIEILTSQEDFLAFVSGAPDLLFINGIAGPQGLWYTYQLLIHHQKLLLANKESIILGGQALLAEKKYPDQLIPIDSEHFSLFLLLSNLPSSWVASIGITASGGPFLKYTAQELEQVTPEQALRHPVWNMGANISLGSATMANKGLEVLEAKELFGISLDHIHVRIHPQSIHHAFVFLKNGSWISHQYPPSMETPIAQAMLYPEMPTIPFSPSETFIGIQDFSLPSHTQFPLLSLAYEVGKKGHFYQIIYTLSNDIANQLFLQKRISFVQIADFVKFNLDFFEPMQFQGVPEILELSKTLSSKISINVEKFLC